MCQYVIDVSAIGQKHIANGARVYVVAVGLDGNLFPEGEGRSGLLRSLPVGSAFLRAVDPAEADAFGVGDSEGRPYRE